MGTHDLTDEKRSRLRDHVERVGDWSERRAEREGIAEFVAVAPVQPARRALFTIAAVLAFVVACVQVYQVGVDFQGPGLVRPSGLGLEPIAALLFVAVAAALLPVVLLSLSLGNRVFAVHDRFVLASGLVMAVCAGLVCRFGQLDGQGVPFPTVPGGAPPPAADPPVYWFGCLPTILLGVAFVWIGARQRAIRDGSDRDGSDRDGSPL